MPNKILIPLQSLISHFLDPPPACPSKQAVGETEGLWKDYSGMSPVAVTQASGGSSVLTLLCAKDQTNENCKHRSGIWQIFQQAMKGIPWLVFPTAFSSCPSSLSWDSSPAKTQNVCLRT